MTSKKVQKYMNQYQERNYAPKNRKIEKSDLIKHSNGSESRQAAETGCGDCVQQSRKEQEEIRNQDESNRKEEINQAHQQGRQGIQISDQGRSETEEVVIEQKNSGEKMKKQLAKEKRHEAKETKAYERKEEKKESKSKKK